MINEIFKNEKDIEAAKNELYEIVSAAPKTRTSNPEWRLSWLFSYVEELERALGKDGEVTGEPL